MTRAKIRQDDAGLHLQVGGMTYRPGSVTPRAHRRRMDDGDLDVGTSVSIAPIRGTLLAALTLSDGTTTFWHADGFERTRGLVDAPSGAVWRPDGSRDFSKVVIG